MSMMKFVVWVIALLVITGCAPQHDDRLVAILALTEACRAQDAAVRVLVPLRAAGKLSQGEIDMVDAAYDATNPVCLGAPPADLISAITQVNQAVTRVLLLAAEKNEEL